MVPVELGHLFQLVLVEYQDWDQEHQLTEVGDFDGGAMGPHTSGGSVGWGGQGAPAILTCVALSFTSLSNMQYKTLPSKLSSYQPRAPFPSHILLAVYTTSLSNLQCKHHSMWHSMVIPGYD